MSIAHADGIFVPARNMSSRMIGRISVAPGTTHGCGAGAGPGAEVAGGAEVGGGAEVAEGCCELGAGRGGGLGAVRFSGGPRRAHPIARPPTDPPDLPAHHAPDR